MKMYLDTNIIWGWFRNIMKNIRKGRKFKIPSILEFITSKPELELSTSNLTKVEICRYLKSDWDCEKKLSEELWERFLHVFNISYVVFRDIDLDEIMELCLEIPTKKKTIINLIHLQIAKKEDLWFLTGEKELKKRYKKYHDKILTYKDLRKEFS